MENIIKYCRKGFIPDTKDITETFVTRAERTIIRSYMLKEQIKEKKCEILTTFLNRNDYILNPNEKEACERMYERIGIYPSSFVGVEGNFSNLIPSQYYSQFEGLMTRIEVEGYNIPIYFLKKDKKDSLETSIHELYHCIMNNSSETLYKRKKRGIKNLINIYFEEFRANLIGEDNDLQVEEKIAILEEYKEVIYDQAKKDLLPLPVEDYFNPIKVRRAFYKQAEHEIWKFLVPKSRIESTFASALLTSSSIIPAILFPLGMIIKASYIAIAMGISSGLMVNCTRASISNRRIKKAQINISSFMAEERDALKEEFSLKGTHFLNYTINYQEMQGIKHAIQKKESIKDYFHKKKTLRGTTLLVYADHL